MSDSTTIYLDNPSDSAREKLEKFFGDAGIAVEWATSADGADAVIDWPEDKEICVTGVLHAGGRVTCPYAFATASKMKIGRSVMGELMNHLDIRINECQLGCFK
jgi:hypothetical protein